MRCATRRSVHWSQENGSTTMRCATMFFKPREQAQIAAGDLSCVTVLRDSTRQRNFWKIYYSHYNKTSVKKTDLKAVDRSHYHSYLLTLNSVPVLFFAFWFPTASHFTGKSSPSKLCFFSLFLLPISMLLYPLFSVTESDSGPISSATYHHILFPHWKVGFWLHWKNQMNCWRGFCI